MDLEQWTLKDKGGNPPPPNILSFIKKLNKKLLLPCPRSPDDLEMPAKETVPREMNSFIVFRRQLAYVAKTLKSSEDGRLLSTAASYIWNGASQSEKQSYTEIAEELKKRHRLKNPNYTYERRKRKTAEEDFIILNVDTITQTQHKKKKRTKKSEPTVVHISEEQECVPNIPTPVIQERGDREWFNPPDPQVNCFNTMYCDSFDNNDNCYNEFGVCDENLPLVLQEIMTHNYITNLGPQLELQQQQIQPQLLYNNYNQPRQQMQPPTFEYNNTNTNVYYYGNIDVGINQPLPYEGLERPVDDVLYNNRFI